MANMTFKADLLPSSNLGYSLGSSDKLWNIYGKLQCITVDTTTLNNTTGNFIFKGNSLINNQYDWIGFQCDAGNDKFQVIADSGSIRTRQNDVGGDNSTDWTEWAFHLTDKNYTNYAIAKHDPVNTTTFLRGDNTWTNQLTNTFYSTASPGFNNTVTAGAWSYLRLHNGSNTWDIATRSDYLSGGLQFRPASTNGNIGPYIQTNGAMIFNNCGNTSAGNYGEAAMQIREFHYGGAQSDTWGNAPRLTWHWSGRVAAQIGLASSGWLCEAPSTGTTFYKLVCENGGTWNINAYSSNWLNLAPSNKTASTGAAQTDDTGPFVVRWYSNTNLVAQQPSQYGFMITCATGKGSAEMHQLFLQQCDGHIYHRGTNGSNNASPPAFKMLWQTGDAVTGAVWNDYAEYRESHDTEFGYVVQEVGDDTLQKTSKRLDHFAGVTSDTWGFAQGETEKAKTPIAVAGRVLVYPGEDKNKYQPGDCVCAGPNGKVYIMTREEIREWPDRIVGTVSCVPNYEEWGGGEIADRPPVKVNGRIWIKVK